MVNGFGANGQLSEKRLIPNELLCYRMLRFRPRRGYSIGTANDEWRDFVEGLNPRQRMSAGKWQSMQDMAMLKTIELAELYYGKDEWQPCLTATSHGHVTYGAGEHAAICANFMFSPVDPTFHEAPKDVCTCGFWAYYTPDAIDIGTTTEWTSLVAVEVWGDVVLGTKGVRAQKMKIIGVMVPDEVRLTENYDVVKAWNQVVAELGVPQYWNKAEFLLMHPPQDVSELLPKAPLPPKFPYAYYEQLSRYQFWPNVIQPGRSWTYSVTNTTAATSPQSYYSIIAGAYAEEKCCVCGYIIISRTQAEAYIVLEKHIMDTHSGPTVHCV